MEFSRTILCALICTILLLLPNVDGRPEKSKSKRYKRNQAPCRARSLVRYQVTVRTLWDKATFPKMYPKYRPPAHWSPLIGRSHGAQYSMWQEGRNASLAVQRFATDQDSKVFDLELSQGYNDVLDAFIAPTVVRGVGETSAVFAVDAGRSKVSFIMALVPSPDWFVGLDSFNLCYRGRWKKRLQRDLRPFDAGTDQGRTFTSPSWLSNPLEPISVISSTYPNHPACSFFYPEYKVLPPIASVEFEMISEYRLRKVHKEVKTPERNMSAFLNTIKKPRQNDEPSDNDKLSRNEEPGANLERNLLGSIAFPTSADGRADNSSPTSLHRNTKPAKTPEQALLRPYGRISNPKPVTLGRPEIIQAPEMGIESTKRIDPEYGEHTDCIVSEWSEWSPCSQTCGFGNKHRFREAIQLPIKGGSFCPLLKETSLCGSMRNCRWAHFSFMKKGKGASSPFNTFKRRRRVRGRGKRRHTSRRE